MEGVKNIAGAGTSAEWNVHRTPGTPCHAGLALEGGRRCFDGNTTSNLTWTYKSVAVTPDVGVESDRT